MISTLAMYYNHFLVKLKETDQVENQGTDGKTLE